MVGNSDVNGNITLLLPLLATVIIHLAARVQVNVYICRLNKQQILSCENNLRD